MGSVALEPRPRREGGETAQHSVQLGRRAPVGSCHPPCANKRCCVPLEEGEACEAGLGERWLLRLWLAEPGANPAITCSSWGNDGAVSSQTFLKGRSVWCPPVAGPGRQLEQGAGARSATTPPRIHASPRRGSDHDGSHLQAAAVHMRSIRLR
ncbi:hypothetical protein CCMA1212_004690 [Trichoderma ghanense]|uniref:Uncharacterized protein n=1 Tax=Trichoderma ghanense TaxID=65468 RepID=A0ABY2H5X8_9HYPO